jgi:hypothetical protein
MNQGGTIILGLGDNLKKKKKLLGSKKLILEDLF